jgi:predicted O-methyltransferase YrrM
MKNQSEKILVAARGTLTRGADLEREERVLRIGNLTGLREENGKFRKANFERGLLLDGLVEALQPREVLELGTGRGLGAFVMAATPKKNHDISIITLDVLTTDTKQHWPIESDGHREVRHASRREVWSEKFPDDMRRMVNEVCGPTTAILPQLIKDGRRFDLIFIDAGHDLFNVVHDLCYSALLLSEEGWILMDDFAPASEYGLATCLASMHARRMFGVVEVLPTEGVVFGDAQMPGLPRNMVLLGERKSGLKLTPFKLAFWRMASAVLDTCYRPSMFPLSAKA